MAIRQATPRCLLSFPGDLPVSLGAGCRWLKSVMRHLAVMAAWWFAVGVLSAAEPPNVLPEGSFELLDNGVAKGWELMPGAELKTDGTNHFLQFTNTDHKASAWARAVLKLDPGWSALRISARLKATKLEVGPDGWNNARCILNFRTADGKDAGMPPPPLLTADADWGTQTVTVDIPKNAATLHLQPGLWAATGVMCLDDVTIIPVEKTVLSPEPMARASQESSSAKGAVDSVLPRGIIEVKNNGVERFEEMASLKLSSAGLDYAKHHLLIEAGDNGKVAKVKYSLVALPNESPMVVWQIPGIHRPNEKRYFKFIDQESENNWRYEPMPATADLVMEQTDNAIMISNSYFLVRHPKAGNGGFPDKVTLRQSGKDVPALRFLDRIKSKTDKTQQEYWVSSDNNATAKVVYSSNVRVVVEVSVRPLGAVCAPVNMVYRYTYSPNSPVVDVEAAIIGNDGTDTEWFCNLLQISCELPFYDRFLLGPNGVSKPMNKRGVKSIGYTGIRWGVMASTAAAIGVGGCDVSCWDASNEWVYYIGGNKLLSTRDPAGFKGRLYFGPANEHPEWFTRWLDSSCSMDIQLQKNSQNSQTGNPPPKKHPLQGKYELLNNALRVVFADGSNGFDCIGIENLLADRTRFVRANSETPGLWRIELREPYISSKEEQNTGVIIDNHTKAVCSAEVSGTRVIFTWKDLDLPGESGVIDVTAQVDMVSGNGPSEWRISINNRSKKYGLWKVDYPLLTTVCPRGEADVLVPTGNWGGTLFANYDGAFRGNYPSSRCPVQFMAFNQGAAGLYVAAHDGEARPKELVIAAGNNVTFSTYAENMGVPGSRVCSPFPVVVQGYVGDWWQAAKIYRDWASQQVWTQKGLIADRADIPAAFKELGLWQNAGGSPGERNDDQLRILRQMKKAFQVYSVPVGNHWYQWHTIPFDTSYPEYFPAKPNFEVAVRNLVKQGVVVMPYTNGRLWDRDIKSFQDEGILGACKQRSGEVYTEIYDSKRRLSPMCPYSPIWQKKLLDIATGLRNLGVNAIYFDQIGAMSPALCFDKTHGHSLGGGSHWVNGYRKALNAIKKDLHGKVAVTTENTAEPYMDNIDGFLVWLDRFDNDVPLLPAVYSGYTIYFGSPQDWKDNIDAYVMAQGRDFLWGAQLGWEHNWFLSDSEKYKQLELNRFSKYRLAAKDYMVYGQLIGEIQPLNALPRLTTTWHRSSVHDATLPAVMGTIWRDKDGKSLVVVLVNYDNKPQYIDYEINLEKMLSKTGSSSEYISSILTPDGSAPYERIKSGTSQHSEYLAKREIRMIKFRSLGNMQDYLDQAQAIIATSGNNSFLASAAKNFISQGELDKHGILVSAPQTSIKMAKGEPANLQIKIENMSDSSRTFSIAWADKEPSEVVCPPHSSRIAEHVFWPNSIDATVYECSATVSCAALKIQKTIPLYAEIIPAITAVMGKPPLDFSRSFMLPVTLTNHSHSPQRVSIEMEAPAGWELEPGNQIWGVVILPDSSREISLKVTPRLPTSGWLKAPIKLNLSSTTLYKGQDLKLAIAPVAEGRFFKSAPIVDGKLDEGEWGNAKPFMISDSNGNGVKIKGYTGDKDCSAKVRVGWNKNYFFFGAEVVDDVHFQDQRGGEIYGGDCIQLAFCHPPSTDTKEFGLALTAGNSFVYQSNNPVSGQLLSGAKIAISRRGECTTYEAAIPWGDIGILPKAGENIKWSLTVIDNDGSGFRGWLEWTPGICGGKNAAEFGVLNFIL